MNKRLIVSLLTFLVVIGFITYFQSTSSGFSYFQQQNSCKYEAEFNVYVFGLPESKNWSDDERNQKLQAYCKTKSQAAKLNSQVKASLNTKSEDLERHDDNEYSLISPEEFKSSHHNLELPADIIAKINNNIKANSHLQSQLGASTVKSLDWRQSNIVSPVKNQGSCGSCWSFATIATIESRYAMKNKKFATFSEQQIVDCSTQNHGCNGGWPEKALNYVYQNGGIDYSSNYPYTGYDGYCRANQKAFKIDSFQSLYGTTVATLEATLIKQGPLAVFVDANNWQSYRGGIFSSCNTGPQYMDHCVTLVGFTSDYWLIKNSWGTNWGEQGYIRVSKNGGCGILNTVSYPIINDVSPPGPNPDPTPTPTPTCQDSDSRCPGWASAGECTNNPNYMLSKIFPSFHN